MPQLSPTEHRTIMVVDVADFTNPTRIVADLMAVQEGVYEVLREALDETGVRPDQCDIEDRGDGALILVHADVAKSRLADLLPDRLVAALRRYNATRVASSQFKLRIGIHSGDIRKNSNGWVGHAVNLACRILEASEVKAALAQSDAMAALVASDHFFGEVIKQDPGTAPQSYRRLPVTVKTFEGEIWLRLLGEIVVAHPAEPPESPELPVATAVPTGPVTDDVLDVAPDEELAALRNLLEDVNVARLPMIASRATGPAVPMPQHGSAWDVFRYLCDFNADEDGVPPAFAFLELLAGHVGGELETDITAWVDHQARRLRLVHVLKQRRIDQFPIQDAPRLHLMIVLEPDAIDPGRCVLSYWRQNDPQVWPPNRGDVGEVAIDELEHRIDEIVVDAERMWAGQVASVVVEFVLARSMLNLPVLRWRKEHQSGDPRLLTLDYRVCLRSLERMRNSHWHRAWRVRWDSMVRIPGLERIFPFGPVTSEEQPIDAVLSDPRWGGLVLAQPPSPVAEPGATPDTLTAALRAGLPLICWHPSASPEDLRELVDWLVGGEDGLVDLLGRRKAAHSALPALDLVRDLVVMLDDPNRVIAFG